MDNLLQMSAQELTRLEVMQRLTGKPMSQKEAGRMLGLSTRQIKWLLIGGGEAESLEFTEDEIPGLWNDPGP